MTDPDAPCHAHVYFTPRERAAAEALRETFLRDKAGSDPHVLFVGPMRDKPVGPHPMPQFEIHFAARSRAAIVSLIESSGLTALVHPLTDDDLADHTSLAHWIGEPLELDLSVLDRPGVNQGATRFGKDEV